MPKVEQTTIISRPVGEIYAYLCDLEQLPARAPSITNVNIISKGVLKEGMRFEVTSSSRGRQIQMVNEIFDLVENRSIGFRTISGTQPYEEFYQFTEVETGTEVVLRATGEMLGLTKFFSRSFKRLLKKQIKNDLERLKDLLEKDIN